MKSLFRFLGPYDIEEVKVLCGLWFPIDYPDTWYQEITSNPRFYSLAATLQVAASRRCNMLNYCHFLK